MSEYKADRDALNELIEDYKEVMMETDTVYSQVTGYQSNIQQYVQIRPVDVTSLSIIDFFYLESNIEAIKTYWTGLVEADETAATKFTDAKTYIGELNAAIVQLTEALGKDGGNIENLKVSDIQSSIFQDDAMVDVLLNKYRSDEVLTYSQKEFLYQYFQYEYVTEQTKAEMENIADMVENDSEGLLNRVNSQVLASEEALFQEIDTVEAFLYQGNNKPEDHHISGVEAAKLKTYLSTLKNYRTFILQVRDKHEWQDNIDSPLYARAENLDFKDNENPKYLQFNSIITVDPFQSQNNNDNYTREDFLSNENFGINRPVIKNDSEVSYYYGADAAGDFSQKEELNIDEEIDNLAYQYIADEISSFIIGLGGDYTKPLEALNTFYTYENEMQELTKEKENKSAHTMAIRLDMEIELSRVSTFNFDYNQEGLVLQLHPRDTTYEIIERWKEVNKLGIDFPFPEDEINNLDWEGIVDFINNNSKKMDNSPEINDYILNDRLTIEELKLIIKE